MGLPNISGYTVSQATSGTNAYFALNNSAGTNMGYLGWDHANNVISLVNQTGGVAVYVNPDGSVSTSGNLTCTGTITSTGNVMCSDVHAANAYVSGNVQGGTITSTGDVHAANAYVSGTFSAGNSIFSGLTVNGSAVCTGLLTAQASINATGNYNLTQSGTNEYSYYLFNNGGGYVAKFGCAGNTTSAVGMFVSYGNSGLQIDTSGNFQYYGGTGSAQKNGGGSWAAISDARIKDVTGDYTRGLDAVLQLRPIIYRYKANDTVHPAELSPHKNAAEIGQRFVGLVAQEAETVFPDMVSKGPGFIDGQAVTDLRALDVSELLYALVNSVKELKAEIEALKASR